MVVLSIKICLKVSSPLTDFSHKCGPWGLSDVLSFLEENNFGGLYVYEYNSKETISPLIHEYVYSNGYFGDTFFIDFLIHLYFEKLTRNL